MGVCMYMLRSEHTYTEGVLFFYFMSFSAKIMVIKHSWKVLIPAEPFCELQNYISNTNVS